MFNTRILATVFAAALCLSPARAVSQTAGMSRGDSAAIIRHAWKTVASGYTRFKPGELALWTPSKPDSAHTVPLSPALGAQLVQQGVPASARRPAGDDTVVFVVTKWQPDSAGVVLEFRSRWTTVLGSGSRRCRTSSGNVERVRVRRRGDAWTAEALMPVMHGDTVCKPIR